VKRIRRVVSVTKSRRLWESTAELSGYAVLVFAAWTVNEIAGFILAGLVLLNYGIGRSR
jgi:hypothetical protein